MDIKQIEKDVKKDKEELIKESLKKEVECGEKLSAMRGSPGWKLVEGYITQEMETAMTNLLASKEDRDIYYNQAVVTFIRKLLEKIGVSFQLATNARDELNKYK